MSNNAFGTAENIDPNLPLSEDGMTYHLTCKSGDLADRIVLVGDPARVKTVASYFDKGSITFESSHREINAVTGAYKGERMTVISTGMGTDNVEIIMNEIHILKEYDVSNRRWKRRTTEASSDVDKKDLFDPSSIKIIRVGTCGCPRDDVPLASLAITRHGIGMDNTCQYYLPPSINSTSDLKEVYEKVKNNTTLGKNIQFYVTRAAPSITNGLVAACEDYNLKNPMKYQPYVVGTTCSGSGFYGCQGRAVGRFTDKLVAPNLMKELGALSFDTSEGKEVVSCVEMENSSLCYLSAVLGYEAGTVCAVVARRNEKNPAFSTPEETSGALSAAITVTLDTLAAISNITLD